MLRKQMCAGACDLIRKSRHAIAHKYCNTRKPLLCLPIFYTIIFFNSVLNLTNIMYTTIPYHTNQTQLNRNYQSDLYHRHDVSVSAHRVNALAKALKYC